MKVKDENLLSVTKSDIEDGTFYVPYGVRRINAKAFKNIKKLKYLILPSSVRWIEDGAFDGLSSLEDIFLSNSLLNLPISEKENPNLKVLSIDSSMDNNTLEEINKKLYSFRNISTFKIYYNDYSVGYHEESTNLNIRKINRLKTDRFEIELINHEGVYQGSIIIDKEEMRGYNKNQVCKEDKYFDHLSLIYEGRYDVIMDWEKIMEHNPSKYGDTLPPVNVLKSIPTNSKCIKEFLLKRKSYNSLISDLKLKGHKSLIFNRLLYFIGYFDGNSKHSKEANEFIDKITHKYKLSDVLYYFDFLKSEAPYNKSFVPVLFDCFDYIYNETEKPTVLWNYNLADDFLVTDKVNTNTFKEVGFETELQIGNLLIKQLYDNFDLINKESIKKGIPLKGKNVVDLLSLVKYNVHEGNEPLFDEISKYLAEYNVEDFNKLQEVYEEAREIYKNNTKKIKSTVDTSKNKYKYAWLDPLDPKNFTLGHRANCCARLNHAGEGIMITSILSPSVSNLAIKDNDKIIAKATAYYKENDQCILFNNVEVRHTVDTNNLKDIYISLKRAVMDQVKANEEIKTVAIGMAYNDLGTVIEKNCEKIDPYDEITNNSYRDLDGNEYVDYSGNHKQYYLYR